MANIEFIIRCGHVYRVNHDTANYRKEEIGDQSVDVKKLLFPSMNIPGNHLYIQVHPTSDRNISIDRIRINNRNKQPGTNSNGKLKHLIAWIPSPVNATKRTPIPPISISIPIPIPLSSPIR
jgi:hypothetical protein